MTSFPPDAKIAWWAREPAQPDRDLTALLFCPTTHHQSARCHMTRSTARQHMSVRLTDAEIVAISATIDALTVPNREPPSVSEALRIAILRGAEAIAASRNPA